MSCCGMSDTTRAKNAWSLPSIYMGGPIGGGYGWGWNYGYGDGFRSNHNGYVRPCCTYYPGTGPCANYYPGWH